MSGFNQFANILTSQERARAHPTLSRSKRFAMSTAKFTKAKSLTGVFAAVLACASVQTSSVLAQDTASTEAVYMSGAERVTAGGHMRTAAQQIAVASCFLDAGIEADTFREQINQSVTVFDDNINALRDGNAALGVQTPEEGRKLLSTIYSVTSQWTPFKEASHARLQGGGVMDGTDYVSRHNLNMMHTSQYLLREIIAGYAIPPALLQSDAFTMDVLTRQPAIGFQIAKEACGLITGNTVMGSAARFDKSVDRFDASMGALVNGFEGVGVSAPPTPEARAALESVSAEWTTLKAELAQVKGSNDVVLALSIYRKFDTINDQFEAIIPLYIEASKSGI